MLLLTTYMINVNLLQKEVINDDVNREDDNKKTYTETVVCGRISFIADAINPHTYFLLSGDIPRGPKLKSRPNGSHDSGLFFCCHQCQSYQRRHWQYLRVWVLGSRDRT